MQKIRKLILENKDYFILFLITLIAFWPAALNVYSLKNDALVYFLPYRYHISESVQNGFFPWWNPYLYGGLPVHGDIQSGVWNPVVMIVSVFTTYNMTILQWEMVLYLLVAGVGVYRLIKEFNLTSSTALVCATSYICCGFMTDTGSFVPWTASAAYLPFVFLYFFRLLNKPNLATASKLSIALALLLTAGYPSFFIFSGYIMLVGFISWLIVHFKTWPKVKSVLWYSLISIVILLVLCAPALISWWDFAPYYERGSGADLKKAMSNPFPLFSSISYLLPSAVSKDHEWLNTDRSARNAFVGIFTVIFFTLSIFGKFKRTQKFILAVIVFSFLFCLGEATPIREWCYRFLPFMDSFRHPSSMRIFSSLGIIVLAAPTLNQALVDPAAQSKKLFTATIGVLLLLAAPVLYYLPQLETAKFPGFNKALLDSFDFADIVVFQGLLQVFFLLVLLFLIQKNKLKLLPVVAIINSVVFCWMALPFTFISQVKTSTINQYIKSVPEGFPLPDLNASVTANEFSKGPTVDYKLITKTVSLQDHLITPTINLSYIQFLNDSSLRQQLRGYPFAYLSGNQGFSKDSAFKNSSIRVLSFNNNGFSFEISSRAETILNVFQQYHHGWKAEIDNKTTPIFKSNHAFMGVVLPGGTHIVNFNFQPARPIKAAMILSILAFGLILAGLMAPSLKSTR